MSDESVPAMNAPAPARDNPLTRSVTGVIGLVFLSAIVLVCVVTLPWTLGSDPAYAAADAGGVQGSSVAGQSGASESGGAPRYNAGTPKAGRLPPSWWPPREDEALRMHELVEPAVITEIAARHGTTPAEAVKSTSGPMSRELNAASPVVKHWMRHSLGTDVLGRSLLYRCLTGGGISLLIGIAAALLSVVIGTVYGAVSGYVGGRVDAVLMRIVDILYGLPYILLVVLLAVAVDSIVERTLTARVAAVAVERQALVARELEAFPQSDRDAPGTRKRLEEAALDQLGTGEISLGVQNTINVVTLLVAIGGVSWLTMARVVRGQVLSLKNQPFIEAARAIGVPTVRIFTRHLLPNLLGPITVYATLTVPQAILQESFLSFLGIGVKPPLPSWGNLAADGLSELNPYQSNWWLLLFPCLLLGTTLLALNFVGEGLREAFDPKRAKR